MLCPPKAVSVLLDLSVRQLAVWTRPAVIEKEIVWGERSHSVSLCGWQGRRGLGKEHPWLQEQFECLPSVARLVKDGRLNIFSYSELSFEESRGRRRMQGSFGDILSGVPIGPVRPALERSIFAQTLFRTAEYLEEFTSKEALTKFCKILLYSDLNAIKQNHEFWNNLSDSEKNSIDAIDQFRKLCDSLSPNHFADAFHLWTADRNGLDFFLTADEKFCNATKCNRNSKLRCAPITPSELVKELGILNLVPVPEYDDQPHTYF